MPRPKITTAKSSPLFGLLFLIVLVGLGVAALILLEPANPGQPDPNHTPAGRAGFAKHPRVVTLAPHLAELVHAAGAADHLLAVTRYSDFPSAVKSLPQVGDAFALDYEKLMQWRPELILTWAGGTPEPVLRKLERIGLTVEPVRIEALADIGRAIRRIGTLLGTAETANQQAGFFALELASRQRQSAAMPRQRVFIQTSDKPLYTVSSRHWISEAVALCGLDNVFGDLSLDSAPVEPEAVIRRQPEVIVMFDQSGEKTSTTDAALVPPEQTRWGAWPQIPAVSQQRIIRVNPDLLGRPGPRILRGVAALCEVVQHTVPADSSVTGNQ